MTMKTRWSKTYGVQQSSSKREVCNDTGLPQEMNKQTNKQKSQINNLNLHLKKLKKEEQAKPKISRKKEIIKIRAEINEIAT